MGKGIGKLLKSMTFQIMNCINRYMTGKCSNSVTFGALFQNAIHAYASDGSGNTLAHRQEVGAQHVAAYMMAVDEINNKTDGIQDALLPHTRILTSAAMDLADSFIDPTEINLIVDVATKLLLQYKASDQILAIIDTLDSATKASATQLAIQPWNMVGMIVKSSATQFSNSDMYPCKKRLKAAESYQAQVLASIASDYFKWKKVTIFYGTDAFSSDCFTIFQYASAGKFNILSTHKISQSESDFSSYITAAKAAGARIFIVLMQPSQLGILLEQGYRKGLFGADTQVLGTATESGEIFRRMTPSADIPSIMKGFIGVSADASSYFATKRGKAFMERFRKLPPTIKTDPATGKKVCNQRLVDAKGFHTTRTLYQTASTINVADGSLEVPVCTGIESFQAYKLDGSNVDPDILLTYDAVYVLAAAVDGMIRSKINITGANLNSFMQRSNSFDGQAFATGDISFSPGLLGESTFTKGDRNSGFIYRILNFNVALHQRSKGNQSFGFAGVWQNGAVSLCSKSPGGFTGSSSTNFNCTQMIFKTTVSDGLLPPADQLPPLKTQLELGPRVFLIVLFSILAFVLICLHVSIPMFRNEKVFVNAQPIMLRFTVFGSDLGCIYIYLASLPRTTAVCISLNWLEHISFVFLCGSVLMKLWRLDSIVNNATLKRVKITDMQIVRMLLWSVIIPVGTLVAKTALNSIYSGEYTVTTSNRESVYIHCVFSPIGNVLEVVLTLYEVVYAVATVYYLYRTRAVPAQVNETSALAPGK